LVQRYFFDKEKGINKDLINASVDELSYDGGFGFGGEGFTPAEGSAKLSGDDVNGDWLGADANVEEVCGEEED